MSNLPPLLAYRQRFISGQAFTFSFWNESASPPAYVNIYEFLVGISGFNLSYGSDDHEVLQISIVLTIQAQTSTSITVSATMTLTDGSSTLSLADSSVDVTVLALTSNDPLVVMQNFAPVSSTNAPVAIPGVMQQVLPVLAGFNLAYNSYHYVKTIDITTNCNSNVSAETVSLTSSAYMIDNSGNSASTATVDAGVFINSDPGISLLTASKTLIDCASTTLDFIPIAVFITAILDSYGDTDHWINTMSTSVYSNDAVINSYTETLYSFIRFWDNSGDIQSSNSSVSFTAIGLATVDSNGKAIVYDTVTAVVQ